MLPRDGFRGGIVERVGDGGGWPDALAWAIFALLVTLLVVAILSLALDAYSRPRGQGPFRRRFAAGLPPGLASAGPALALLDARYARGELSRDEYLQVREDLRGGSGAAEEAPTEAKPAPEAPTGTPESPAS